jgi:hypothetical protein
MHRAEIKYLVLDPTGAPVELFDTPSEVLEAFNSKGSLANLSSSKGAVKPKRVIWFDNIGDDDIGLGSADPSVGLAESALKRTGLSPLYEREVMALSLERAWARVRPYLPQVQYVARTDTLRPLKANEGYDSFVDSLLNQNAKTRKVLSEEAALKFFSDSSGVLKKQYTKADVEHFYRKMEAYRIAIEARGFSEGVANVLGLSLMPHTMAHKGPGNDTVEEIRPYFKERYRIELYEKPPVRANLCSGASKECRESCLVFSGHNTASDYNVVRKYALTQALLREPSAFVRLLSESILRYSKKLPGVLKMVRLNVLSDIPWEQFVPWLFDVHSDIQFYDYTKVDGRVTPSNYDLTFSFSGRNMRAMRAEHARGRRVAVVFAAVVDGGKLKRPRPYMLEGLTWLGVPVIDGESSDTRPLDPGGVIVGLPWKAPKGQGDVEVGAFVVKGTLVDGAFTLEQIPRQTTDLSS